jgi:hypothetical protein
VSPLTGNGETLFTFTLTDAAPGSNVELWTFSPQSGNQTLLNSGKADQTGRWVVSRTLPCCGEYHIFGFERTATGPGITSNTLVIPVK